MFKRVLIANRGVVARRIVRACEAVGCESVAAHSDVDANLPHVGEATTAARLAGYKAEETYLDTAKILEAAKANAVDAIHPGYGFLAESSEFARACEKAGIRFIGPSVDWLDRMGEKTMARRHMGEQGFPVHAGSEVLEDETALEQAAARIGYPVILKPAAGGGGIGMSVCPDEKSLKGAFARATTLAQRAFGDGAVYLEKFLARPRHVEIQVLGDGHSNLGLFERDCSVQRRHQKLIEEAPAPGIERDAIEVLQAQALAAVAGYDSLGTVETLYSEGAFGFLEMNTRLQVEHGVTEEVTGIDLVAAQIRIAAGETLSDVVPKAPELNGYAVEARLYAEDSERMLPSTGRLQRFNVPSLTGVRVDAGYAVGEAVTPYYDPLLAKVIGTGTTREQAIGRTLIALKAFEVGGIDTNAALLRRILESEAFIAGNVHTAFLDDLL